MYSYLRIIHTVTLGDTIPTQRQKSTIYYTNLDKIYMTVRQ